MNRAGAIIRYAIVSAILLGVGSCAARTHSAGDEFADFPLYKDVPGRTYATLGEGRLPDKTRWAGFVSRLGHGRRGVNAPCITLAEISRFGEYGAVHECGPLAPVAPNLPPVLANTSVSTFGHGNSSQTDTFIGMSFQATVTSGRLENPDGERIRFKTRALNPAQVRKARVVPLRYAVLALPRAFCVATVSGYATGGELLFEGATGQCQHPSRRHS